jgi:hypothetical protein
MFKNDAKTLSGLLFAICRAYLHQPLHGVSIMKTRPAVLTMAVLLVTLLLPIFAPQAALAFYCGGNLVQVGDSVESLYANCGPPTLKLTPQTTGGEVWFYNEGSSQFMTKITVFAGKIIAIEEGDYGSGSPSSSSQ